MPTHSNEPKMKRIFLGEKTTMTCDQQTVYALEDFGTSSTTRKSSNEQVESEPDRIL